MPDLGKYALEVTLAYGVSLTLMGVLVLFVLRRAAKARALLTEAEARAAKAKGAS